MESDSGVLQFDAHFDQLHAGTTYQARAIAIDSLGHESQAPGEFTTLNRYVEVSFSGAQIVNHAYSHSDFSKCVWAEGEWLDDYLANDLDLIDGDSLEWGTNEIYLGEVPQYLDFAVELVETDISGDLVGAAACDSHSEPFLSSGGDHTWSYAYLDANDLDDRPADATSWTEHTIHTSLQPFGNSDGLPPGYGEPLSFYVPITIHVIYQ